ncbi:unnamed protein product [Ranitomeya imitator]|uniref:Uncharacterized protein n=1 Tax=Ranitomeya imitator TaxID=111125 RepID=A0ABN9KX77_9NEOB|nr:unnamed protein product [Ranitomeya imitator]
MSQKFKHFKDVLNLQKIKLEESEKSQKEISDLRRELEKTYQLKTMAWCPERRMAVERLQRQQRIEQKFFEDDRLPAMSYTVFRWSVFLSLDRLNPRMYIFE